MATLRLEILTAERVLFEGDVDVVVAPGTEGELGILPMHASLMSTLQPGELRYRVGGEESFLAVTGGFIEVTGDKVIILADAAERVEEIDEARALEAVRKAEQRVLNRSGDIELERALRSLRRAQVRVATSARRRRRTSSS